MGGVTSHCIVGNEEKVDTVEQYYDHAAPLGRVEMSEKVSAAHMSGCSISVVPKCDMTQMGKECLDLSRSDALSDQECLDIMLIQAVMRGDLSDVNRALLNGAKVNTIADISLNMGVRDRRRIKRVTPLMRACEFGHVEVASHLLKVRADPMRQDTRQWIPVCYALGAGEIECARRLLEETPELAPEEKDIVATLQKGIIEQCEEEIGEECAVEVLKEFGPGGFLCPDRGERRPECQEPPPASLAGAMRLRSETPRDIV